MENGLPIKSFYDDKSDLELIKIGDVLENLSQVHDVREYLREIISLNQVDYERANKIFEEFKQNKAKQNKNLKIKQPINTSTYNENNISVIKSVDIDEQFPSEYHLSTNYNHLCSNDKNFINANIQSEAAVHVRNKSSLETEQKLLIALADVENKNINVNKNLSHRNLNNNNNKHNVFNQLNNNTNGDSTMNTFCQQQVGGINNESDNNSNELNKNKHFNSNNSNDIYVNSKNENLDENQNQNNGNINFNNINDQRENNNPNPKFASNNLADNKKNVGNYKEKMYEKITEKFNKQQNQLKILHVEKINMQRSSQITSTYSSINNIKNLKKMKSTRNPIVSANLMGNSISRAKLNSKRLGNDSSKESSLIRNSFLNNSNTTKNSLKTEFFKLKNFNNLTRSKDNSSKKNNFFINSERANYNRNSNNFTKNGFDENSNRDNSAKSDKFSFTKHKHNSSNGNFIKIDKEFSHKNLKPKLKLHSQNQNADSANEANKANNDKDHLMLNNKNEYESEKNCNFDDINKIINRPASVSNSNTNRVFKSFNNNKNNNNYKYFSGDIKQNSLKINTSNGHNNTNKFFSNFNTTSNSNRNDNLNNNSNQNSYLNNIENCSINATGNNNNNISLRALLENRIKNNIKNDAAKAAAEISLNERQLRKSIGVNNTKNNNNNNSNKINSIRVNKDINNNKNQEIKYNNKNINDKFDKSNNASNEDNLYSSNKANLEKLNSESQFYSTNKTNFNNENNIIESEALFKTYNLPVPLQEKTNNIILGVNESIEINTLNKLNIINTGKHNDNKNLYLQTNITNVNNSNGNLISSISRPIKGNSTTKHSANNLMNNLFASQPNKNSAISQSCNYTANNTNVNISNNNLNNSSNKIRTKKSDSTPRHSFNALDLKKAALQDQAISKMNFFSKNIINAAVTVRNVSALQKINKKDLMFNNAKNTNRSNTNRKNENTNKDIISNNHNNLLNNIDKGIIYTTSSRANIDNSKNIAKNNSKNTIEKIDEFMKNANQTATARNAKNGKMFTFDGNNKSIHNNSANTSKEKYFAILNKKSN